MADETFKAFVGGLPFDSLASDIETLLEFCDFSKDEIAKFEIHLVHDRESGNFKGFAYVNFENEQQLNTAISKLNGADFASRVLKVNRAQPRDRNDRGGRGGGGRGGFGGDRGGRGGRGGGGGGGFRRGGGGRFNDNEGRGGFGGGGHRGYRQRKESGEAGNQHEDVHNPRHRRQSEESGAPSAPPAERPRLNLKPRTTDAAEIEARKKQEEEETRKRQEKLFQ